MTFPVVEYLFCILQDLSLKKVLCHCLGILGEFGIWDLRFFSISQYRYTIYMVYNKSCSGCSGYNNIGYRSI